MEDFNIPFDTFEIDENIVESNEAKIKDSIFIFYDPKAIEVEPSEPKYIADISSTKFNYIGVLTGDLQRVEFGMNIYGNKDKYIGKWNENTKHEIGVYHFNNINDKEQQFYFGEWDKGEKKGKGIYLWKHSDSSILDLSLSSYDVFFGNFEGDSFIKGIIIQNIVDKNNIDRIIYSGGINLEGKKQDANALLIENENVFIGEFSNDLMVKGTVIVFEQEHPKTFYSFSKREVDNYTFNLKKDNEVKEEIDIANKAKEQCKTNNYFSFIEELYKEYLDNQNTIKLLVNFRKPESFFVFQTLDKFLKNDHNFSLL